MVEPVFGKDGQEQYLVSEHDIRFFGRLMREALTPQQPANQNREPLPFPVQEEPLFPFPEPERRLLPPPTQAYHPPEPPESVWMDLREIDPRGEERTAMVLGLPAPSPAPVPITFPRNEATTLARMPAQTGYKVSRLQQILYFLRNLNGEKLATGVVLLGSVLLIFYLSMSFVKGGLFGEKKPATAEPALFTQ